MAGSIQTGKRKDAHPPLEVRNIVVVTLHRRVLGIPYKWNVALTHVSLSNFIWAIHSQVFIFSNQQVLNSHCDPFTKHENEIILHFFPNFLNQPIQAWIV